jgi:hypothetical protein
MERGSVFHQRRIARYLMMFAILSPLTGPLAMLISPLVSVVAIWRAKRWPMLFLLGLSMVGSAAIAAGSLAIQAPFPDLAQFVGASAMISFVGICLSSPLWLALTLWGEGRPKWHLLGYAMLLLSVGGIVPVLLTALVGVSIGALGLVVSAVAMFFTAWPILKQLPPIPELYPLVEALDLQPTNEGWRGSGVFVSRRGQLTLDLHFSAPIPGLFAAKRGHSAQASEHPLLGDAVLDSTLELALPSVFQHLVDEPSLLLEAVHGAQAHVSESGLRINRQLDKAAFKADPYGSRDRVLRELEAAEALFDALELRD